MTYYTDDLLPYVPFTIIPSEARSLLGLAIDVCMASLRVSKTSFLVGTRTLALSTGASVSDIRGLQIYSLAGLNSPCWSMFA